MANSAQITEHCKQQANPEQALNEIIAKTRYFLAQVAAEPSFKSTREGYFRGKVVVPGPLGHKALGRMVGCDNPQIIFHKHYIRVVDSATTDGADASVSQALYTSMTPQEADEYEAEVFKQNPNLLPKKKAA